MGRMILILYIEFTFEFVILLAGLVQVLYQVVVKLVMKMDIIDYYLKVKTVSNIVNVKINFMKITQKYVLLVIIVVKHVQMLVKPYVLIVVLINSDYL